MIQQGARIKRRRQQHAEAFISQIDKLEKQNMAHASQKLTDQLTLLCSELRLLFLEDFEKASRRLKLSYYTSGNRSGKMLANKLRGHRYKTQIPFIIHPTTHTKQNHPQAIADAFSQYYGSL